MALACAIFSRTGVKPLLIPLLLGSGRHQSQDTNVVRLTKR